MDLNNVPQDDISTYAKNKKAIYATNEQGEYQVIASTGWDVEGEATLQALNALQEQADDAYKDVVSGNKSCLYYYMYAQRMDLIVLAQSVGTFQWRIKRHFKPRVFNRLSEKWLNIYADALGVTVNTLQTLPILEEQ